MYKYNIIKIREYIFLILTATIFLTASHSKSLSEENVFIVDNVEVEGNTDLNFNRNKFIDKAFLSSFQILMSKILLSSDFNKIKEIKLKKIKSLINSFQILDESYKNKKYTATYKVFYNDKKVKKLLSKKNISFSQPKNITAVLYPVLFINEDLQNFDKNFFYNQWNEIKIKTELITFILPVEDLDDIVKIKKIKNNIEDLNVNTIIQKYNTNNYVFLLIENENKKLNIYLKTNFNNNRTSKNIFYKIENIDDKEKLSEILKNLKMEVTDIWKGENVINLSIPLSINVKFKNTDLDKLEKLKQALGEISIIDKYSIREFNINYSFFQIYYFGNPKKLKTELLEFNYQLINDQGDWEIKYD